MSTAARDRADLSRSLDRLRASALHRTLRILGTVDPAAIWLTWPTASTALVAVIGGTQDDAAAAVTEHLEHRVDRAVGARLGWGLAGLVVGSVPLSRLAARMSATPTLVAARVAAGATPVEAFTATATWVTRIAGSVAHETARQGTAVAAQALPVFSGWRWDPEAGACPWCRMQASRGAVFTADTVLHSHSHCRCDAVEVVDRAEAARIRQDGRDEWARMQAAGDVPAGRRHRALPNRGTSPSLTQTGAQTPERLASVRAQIASYERRPASGAAARAWQEETLTRLRLEEAGLASALAA